ncbi:MAG: NADH-quinone oxidoreductase subunit D [Myxococcales bacterium]|nr:NADH-quinone oxidoreductase subunit D [Myxococcales bacterium]
MTEVVLQNDNAMDEEMTLNMGPHHPSTHGVLRFVLKSDGEILRKATPEVGYLHRAIEKIGERNTYPGFMPYTDRVDYVAAMFANECWATACEKLMDVEVPKRAQYLRAISCELNRIASHMVALGCTAMDIGAITPFPWALRERERANDLVEELCGARLTFNYHRIGGVSFDLPKGWRDKALAWLDRFDPAMEEFDRLITYNEIFVRRLANVAIITGEEAVDWGLVGPNLRASGVAWDLRKEDRYGVYPELEFDVPVGKGEVGTVGDCWDRFWVRVVECRESSRLLRQCLDKIDEHPEDDIVGKLPKKMKPDGEAYARVESARGDMGCYVIGKGATEPYRVRFRTGSFNAMSIIEAKSPGLFVADLVALIASLDVVAPEIDR